MQKETNLRSFIIHKGLNQKSFFDKILLFYKGGKRKSFGPATMSKIVSGTKVPYKKDLYTAIQTAFNLSDKDLRELQDDSILINYSTREDKFKSNAVVDEKDLSVLIEIKKVTKDRFTLDFAIKTLTELVRQNSG